MSETGASGFRRSDQGDSSLPPPIVAFDPAGEISVADTRSTADSRAARFAAVADDFAARFGLDGADDFAGRFEIDDAEDRVVPPAWTGMAAPVAAGPGTSRPRRVTITGRGAERYPTPRELASRREIAARRPVPTLSQRMGFRADRAALWAVALGLLLVLIAAASAHAAAFTTLH